MITEPEETKMKLRVDRNQFESCKLGGQEQSSATQPA